MFTLVAINNSKWKTFSAREGSVCRNGRLRTFRHVDPCIHLIKNACPEEFCRGVRIPEQGSACSGMRGQDKTEFALVGDNRIEFVITQSSFIDTQAGAYILGEKQVVPGVFACPPLVKTGKMAPIPFFKPFAIQMEEFTQGGTVDRLTIEIVLLKKRRTRGSGECRQLLQPSHACRDHPFACPASGDGEPARCNPCP